jgi:hypothetical protein
MKLLEEVSLSIWVALGDQSYFQGTGAAWAVPLKRTAATAPVKRAREKRFISGSFPVRRS